MNKRKIYYGVLIGVLSIVILSLIFNENLWGDEAFTMLTLKGDFKEIINTTALDVHPPLYYIIAKIFTMILGYSVPVVKLASVVPIILTMILGATYIEKNWGETVLIPSLFIISMAFAPNFLHMSYELRMYSWGTFFVTFSALCALKIYKEGINLKNTSIFIIVSLGAAYTHYFALASVAIIYLYLFISLILKNKSYIKQCIIISIITVVGYLPWFFIFLKQLNSVSSNYWIDPIKFDTIINYIKYPFGNELININLILCIIAVITLIFNIYNNKNKQDSIFALMCISLYFLTVLLGTILSFAIRPIFVIRYAFPTSALLWLGILLGLKEAINSKFQWIFILSIILLNGFYSYQSNYHSEYDKGIKVVKEYMSSNATKDNIITTNNVHFNWTVLRYYFPDNKICMTNQFNFKNMRKGEVIYQFSKSPDVGISEEVLKKNNISYKLELSSNIDTNLAYIYKLVKD